MRVLAAAAAALVLAACGVDVEGAPCATSENCPTGQGCGADLRCGAKALGCTTACRLGDRRCADGALSTCVAAADGVCASWSVAACGDARACQEGAAGAACVCVSEPEPCQGVEGSACDASGALVSCARDAQGCLHIVAETACVEHERCGGAAPAATCACEQRPTACAFDNSFCDPSDLARKTIVNCPATPTGCTYLAAPTLCAGRTTCQGSAGTAHCACEPVVDCPADGVRCALDGRSVVTCQSDGDGCHFAQSSLLCGANQACSDASGTAACVCNPAPLACGSHSGSFCSAPNVVTTCPRDQDLCTTLQGQKTCGPHQTCGGNEPNAACACVAEPRCAAAGPSCSADRTQVLTCSRDGDTCLFVDTASTVTCLDGQVCGDASPSCVAKYDVGITSPAANAIVAPSGVDVTVSVTLGTADANIVPVPTTLPLVANGTLTGTTLGSPVQSGRTVTYTGHYTPLGNLEASVQLSTSVGSVNASVTVQVDTKPPALSLASLACNMNPCLRDSVLTVSVTASDAGLDTVSASLDLDGGARAVRLSNTGPGTFTAQLSLKDWPFAAFQRDVLATITARDVAGNASSIAAGPVRGVTRLRWTYPAGASVSMPAVMSDGTVVVGIDSPSNQLRAVNPDGTERWKLSLGTKPVRSAPAVGSTAIWVGSEDGKLYAVKLDGTSVLTSCGPTLASVTTPALRSGPEVAFAGTSVSTILAATADVSAPFCDHPSSVNKVNAPLVLSQGFAMAATNATNLAATFQRFHESSPGVLVRDWSAVAGQLVTAPLAALATGEVIAGSGNGEIYGVDPTIATSGASSVIIALTGAAQGGLVVHASGDLLLGTNDGLLHRVSVSAGTDRWATAPAISAVPTGVVLVAPDASGAFLIATFADGSIAAFRDAGAAPGRVWPAVGELPVAGDALSAPTVVAAPPTAPAAQLGSLYAGSADGKLYSIVVDTGLDTASPWPKSHHDLRNSGNASFPLP